MMEHDFLVLVYAFKKSIAYLLTTKVIVHTDHVVIKYLMAKKEAKPRLNQRVLLLQEFNLRSRNRRVEKTKWQITCPVLNLM